MITYSPSIRMFAGSHAVSIVDNRKGQVWQVFASQSAIGIEKSARRSREPVPCQLRLYRMQPWLLLQQHGQFKLLTFACLQPPKSLRLLLAFQSFSTKTALLSTYQKQLSKPQCL